MKISSKEEAEILVSNRLNKHATAEKQFKIMTEGTIEKSFGWIFFYEIISDEVREAPQNIRPLIINKLSGQVIGNSTDKSIESILKLYEELLSKRKAIAEGWCLTFDPRARQSSPLKKLAEKAMNSGFYEITDEEQTNQS